MQNFATWPVWLKISLGIVVLALAVAGLREFPDPTKPLEQHW